MAKETQFRLSILGVGGATPTPIPSSKGGFVRDNKRNLVTTQLDAASLQQLASDGRGRYRTLANTGSDITALMDLPTPEQHETQQLEREFDSWYDRGHWLVLLLLPIILYCFRRGVLMSLLLVPLLGLSPNKSYALSWDDLWKNNNQQAYEKLQQQQAAEAAQQFDRSDWKASAQYRAGNYEEAAKNFAQFNSADAHYNRGNALAKANKLTDAIKAYDQALKLNPTLEDAKNNRQLVEDLLKQQQNQDQQQQQDKNEQDKKDQQQQDQQDQGNNKQQNQQQQQDKNDQQNQDQQQEKQSDQQQESQQQQDQQQDQQSSADQNEEPEQTEAEQSEQEQQEKSDEQKAAEAAQREQEQQEQQAAEQQQQIAEPTEDDLSEEERQAMEQWLRRVPDDPGGLLRNKFKYEHYKRNQEILNGDWTPPENGAENRW